MDVTSVDFTVVRREDSIDLSGLKTESALESALFSRLAAAARDEYSDNRVLKVPELLCNEVCVGATVAVADAVAIVCCRGSLRSVMLLAAVCFYVNS